MAKKTKKQSDKSYLRTPIQTDEKVTREEFLKHLTASINFVKKVSKTENVSDTALLNLKGEAMKHRADVLWKYFEEVVATKYGDLIYENDLAVIWAHMNTFAQDMATLDVEKRIMLGAAIWVLDHADISEESDIDVLHMLECAWEEADSSFDDDDVWDGSHAPDMITSVKYILSARNRNVDNHAFENGNYWTAYNPQGKADDEGKEDRHRKNYERLLSTIPKSDIDHAVEKFEAYCWEWLDRVFGFIQPYCDDYKGHLRIYNDCCIKSNEVVEALLKIRDTIDKTTQSKTKNATISKKPAAAPIMMPNIMQDTFTPRELFQKRPLSKMMPPELSTLGAMWQKYDLLADEADDINEKCKSESRQIDDLFIKIINIVDSTFGYCSNKQDLFDYHEKKILDIDDPYEACFAMLYMMDTNHDMSWLRGPFFGAGHEAGGTLPWGFGKYQDENSPAYGMYQGKENPAEIPDAYKRTFTTKDDNGIQRNIAQFLYSATGCIIPRCMDSFDAAATEMRKRGIKGKTLTVLLSMMSVMYAAKNKQSVYDIGDSADADGDIYFDDYDFNDSDDEETRISALTTQNEEYKAEIARLKAALHDTERSLRDAKRDKEKQDRNYAANVRELADLREIIFNRDNEDDEASTTRTPQAATEDCFPYNVKKTTVVFGGHDTWLKAIKPRLEGDIRFIAGDISSFDENLIRCADVVWVQPNAIKHRVFYKITNITRPYNIPMRYFTNASAFLSAVQLMEYDQEKKC